MHTLIVRVCVCVCVCVCVNVCLKCRCTRQFQTFSLKTRVREQYVHLHLVHNTNNARTRYTHTRTHTHTSAHFRTYKEHHATRMPHGRHSHTYTRAFVLCRVMYSYLHSTLLLLTAEWLAVVYIVATVLFIIALRGLAHESTAKVGTLYGILGMAVAVSRIHAHSHVHWST